MKITKLGLDKMYYAHSTVHVTIDEDLHVIIISEAVDGTKRFLYVAEFWYQEKRNWRSNILKAHQFLVQEIEGAMQT